MSHNYSGWESRNIDGFKIPLKSIMDQADAKDNIDIELGDGTISMFSWGDTLLTGTIDENELITIETFGMNDDGSGIVMDQIVIPALKDSEGYYEAMTVWEGCEVSLFMVRNGVVKWLSV